MNFTFFDSHAFRLFTICLFIAITMTLCYAKYVDANDYTALHLAQCIRAECNDCKRYPEEPSAIAHVLKKRLDQYNRINVNKRTFDEQIKAYCSVFRRTTDRAMRIRFSSFETPNHGKKYWWLKMRRFTNTFIFDPESIIDPTPNAMHFGGKIDDYRAHRNNWVLVASYQNRFWATR